MTRDIINPPEPPARGRHAAIGDRFRKARLDLGLTLRATATVTGMSMTQVSMIERGDILPSILDLWPLLDYAIERKGK